MLHRDKKMNSFEKLAPLKQAHIKKRHPTPQNEYKIYDILAPLFRVKGGEGAWSLKPNSPWKSCQNESLFLVKIFTQAED